MSALAYRVAMVPTSILYRKKDQTSTGVWPLVAYPLESAPVPVLQAYVKLIDRLGEGNGLVQFGLDDAYMKFFLNAACDPVAAAPLNLVPGDTLELRFEWIVPRHHFIKTKVAFHRGIVQPPK